MTSEVEYIVHQLKRAQWRAGALYKDSFLDPAAQKAKTNWTPVYIGWDPGRRQVQVSSRSYAFHPSSIHTLNKMAPITMNKKRKV